MTDHKICVIFDLIILRGFENCIFAYRPISVSIKLYHKHGNNFILLIHFILLFK